MKLKILHSAGEVKITSGDGGWSEMVGKPDYLTSYRGNFIQEKLNLLSRICVLHIETYCCS